MDATGAIASKPKVSAKAPGKAAAKGKLPPKYVNPRTGETWSGHARPPAWIKDVKHRSKFLIAGGADAAAPPTTGTGRKVKTAGKTTASKAVGATAVTGQPKGPQPPKYRDPKSGATWSGRGPAPAWLSSAKDRTKFLIDGASTAADAKPAVTKAVAKKAPAAKNTAARKASAKKAPRQSVAVPAPVAAVESGSELTA
ncbi:H-NS family nucleoid-associated regulatory protein, partial [Paraburkholderia sp. SIMBA_049]